MVLLPYTATALSRYDIPDTPNNRNVVQGAIVRVFDLQGVQQTIYDDDTGAGGELQKVTNLDGQRTFYIEPGSYTVDVNGRQSSVNIADASKVRTAIQPVASVADLRLLDAIFDGQQVSLSGYYAGSTAGGGIFVGHAEVTPVDDNGVNIAGPITQWVRQLDGFVTPEMFGFDFVNDISPSLQSAIDYLSVNGGGIVQLPPINNVDIDGVEVLSNGITIRGSGRSATILRYSNPSGGGTVAAFSFGQSKTGSGTLIPVSGCKLECLTIDGNRSGLARGSAVRSTVFDGFELNDVHTYDCAGNYGFAIVGTGADPRKDLRVINCSALRCGADGLDIKAGAERVVIKNFYTGGHLDETTGDSVGLDIRGQYVLVDGVYSFDCPELNVRVRINAGERTISDTDWTQTENAKIILKNIFSVGGREGVEISSPPNSAVSASNIHARLATRYGIVTGGSGAVLLSDSSSTENLIGLTPSVTGHLYMSNVVLDRNTQDGLPANTAANITGNNVSIKGNGRYGIQQAATPADTHWRFNNLTLDGNLTNYAVTSAAADGLVEFDAASVINATSRGVQIANASPAKIKFRGGKISGNATNVHTVNPQTVFSGVDGVSRRESGEAVVAVDSTGVKTLSITHGIGVAPRLSRVRLSLVRDTAVNDYAVDFLRLDGTSTSVLTVRVNVSSASATVGATALVSWEVDESW